MKIVRKIIKVMRLVRYPSSSFLCPSSQKDVRSDPKVVQEVSAATDSLLENLGALAVEVNNTRVQRKSPQTAPLSYLFPKFSFQGQYLCIKSIFYPELSPCGVTFLPSGCTVSVTGGRLVVGGLSKNFLILFNYTETWIYVCYDINL